VTKAKQEELTDLKPFAFFTDGGVYKNSSRYFLQNIWDKTADALFSSVDPKNVQIGSILRQVEAPSSFVQPSLHIEPNTSDKVIRIPYEDYSSPEDFKMPKEFIIHIKKMPYTALVKSFAVFFSDIEIEPSRFQKITKRFKDVESVDRLKELGFPLLQEWQEPNTKTTIVEFDLSQR